MPEDGIFKLVLGVARPWAVLYFIFSHGLWIYIVTCSKKKSINFIDISKHAAVTETQEWRGILHSYNLLPKSDSVDNFYVHQCFRPATCSWIEMLCSLLPVGRGGGLGTAICFPVTGDRGRCEEQQPTGRSAITLQFKGSYSVIQSQVPNR